MNNKVKFLGVLILGIVLGFCGAKFASNKNGEMSMHRMADGSMMHNMSGSMEDSMAGMMQRLSGKTGDEFDKAFLREMIVHHKGAVEMAESALVNAKHDEIKTLSQGIISAQEKEISDMEMWLAAWYK